MEVPAISNAAGNYALSPMSGFALQANAGASLAIDMPAGQTGPMSIKMSSEVEMVYGQITQGGQIDQETLKAMIMLLLLQMLMNGGLNEKGQQSLQGLAEAFRSCGQTEMSMVAMRASSMIEIEFGGMGDAAAAPGGGAAPALDVMA